MTTATITADQVKAYLQTVKAIADAIRDAGQIPAGTIYTAVMGSMNADTFDRLIGKLVEAGLVKRDRSHLLHWIGPANA